MLKKNVLICGATGYIGLQLTKLLCNHKYINIKYLCGSSSVGKKIDFYDKDLKKFKLPKISKFNKKYLSDVDIIFTALPNGEASPFGSAVNIISTSDRYFLLNLDIFGSLNFFKSLS